MHHSQDCWLTNRNFEVSLLLLGELFQIDNLRKFWINDAARAREARVGGSSKELGFRYRGQGLGFRVCMTNVSHQGGTTCTSVCDMHRSDSNSRFYDPNMTDKNVEDCGDRE